MDQIFSHPVVAMIFMLGSLVAFHELGHYLVGRLCGVAVEKFSIGFGQRIFSFRRGQTDYLIGWIPLGGYVKFYGSTRNEPLPEKMEGLPYYQAPVWKRALIVFAGPVANFFLAFLVFWVLVIRGIEYPPSIVGDVIENSPAQSAGVLPGDRFVELNGKKIQSWSEMERIFQKSPEQTVMTKVLRGTEEVTLSVKPESVQGRSVFGSIAKIGRVGVALGYPSAVVTLLSPQSILGSAGVKTGDRLDSWKDSTGEWKKIHGLHETYALFLEWKKTGLGAVAVKVVPTSLQQMPNSNSLEKKDGEPREVLLKPSQWPSIETYSGRQYAEKLGIADSHLTLGFVRGEQQKLLQPGDRIATWDGKPVRTIFHLQEIMEGWREDHVELGLIRDFKELKISVPLKGVEIQLPEGAAKAFILDASMLGQSTMPEMSLRREKNPLKAAWVAIEEGSQQTYMMAVGLWQVISGAVPTKALGGPLLIAKVAGDSAKAGLAAFFASMAVISINLGLVNLFPIPVLDGGQLILLAAEGFKRRPLEESTVENFQRLGFVIVMSLVVLALYNDLSRFWGSIVANITGSK